jgi:hypothetical protein
MTMLSTVGGLLLLGTYYVSVARPNFGFVHSGGLWLVQALGLGTNCLYCVANGNLRNNSSEAQHVLHGLHPWTCFVPKFAPLSGPACDHFGGIL